MTIVLFTVPLAFLLFGGSGALCPEEGWPTPHTSSVLEASVDRSSDLLCLTAQKHTGLTYSDNAHVTSSPNPIRNRVVFRAQQICWCRVSGMRISIYDVSGALVRVVEDSTPLLEIDLESGSEMANGTYIAEFELRVDESWAPAGASLLTILQ